MIWVFDDTGRLAAQQERETTERNRANLRDWYEKTFGLIAGPIIHRNDCNEIL